MLYLIKTAYFRRCVAHPSYRMYLFPAVPRIRLIEFLNFLAVPQIRRIQWVHFHAAPCVHYIECVHFLAVQRPCLIECAHVPAVLRFRLRWSAPKRRMSKARCGRSADI